MKNKVLLLVLSMIFSLGFLSAQDNAFTKLADNKDISTIIVSKTILSLAGNLDISGIDLKKYSDKIDKIEIYNSDKKKAIKQIKKEVSNISNDNNYETLVKIKDSNNDISIYARKAADGTFTDLILPINEDNSFYLVRMLGVFTSEDIQNVLEEVQ